MILQGDKDMQVSVKDAELLKRSQPSADYHLIGNMNHLMKTCDTMDQQKQMATYTDPALPLHIYNVENIRRPAIADFWNC